jgi:hypothetical protein
MQYRNCIRKLAHFLLAFGLFSANAARVFAQAIPQCETNVGVPGQLLDGNYGIVYSPVAFDRVEITGERVGAVSELRDGFGVLLGAGNFPHEPQEELSIAKFDLTADEALIAFAQRNGAIVHTCRVKVVAYEPAVHDFAAIKVGDCDLTQLAGLPQLVVDHAQVWTFSQDFEEFSVLSSQIADFSTYSTRVFNLQARSPGLFMLAVNWGKTDNSHTISLCPFTVVSAEDTLGDHGLNDNDICRDVNGGLMRLFVGQTALFSKSYGANPDSVYDEVETSTQSVLVVVGTDELQNAWIIKAIAPGTSSVTARTWDRFQDDGLQVKSCEVVVE